MTAPLDGSNFLRPPMGNEGGSGGSSGDDGCATVIAVLGVIVAAAWGVYKALPWIANAVTIVAKSTSIYLPAASCLVALLLGRGLFYFRTKAQWYYGASEVIFALAVSGRAALALAAEPPVPLDWAAFVGAIYLVVRGMVNMSDAQEARRENTAQLQANGTPPAGGQTASSAAPPTAQ